MADEAVAPRYHAGRRGFVTFNSDGRVDRTARDVTFAKASNTDYGGQMDFVTTQAVTTNPVPTVFPAEAAMPPPGVDAARPLLIVERLFGAAADIG